MKHARVVALAAAGVLLAAGGVVAARSWHRGGGREVLLPAAAHPLATFLPGTPRPSVGPSALQTQGRVRHAALPWVEVQVPAALVAAPCPTTERLPAPMLRVFVPEHGGQQTALMADGSTAWLAFFGAAVADRDHTWVTGVDLHSGQTRTIDTLGTNGVLASSGSAWGTRTGVGPDLLEASLVRARVTHTWRWQDLNGFAPDYVAVSGRTAFLLEFSSEGSWLGGLDLTTGQIGWTERLGAIEPGAFSPGRDVYLTSYDGDAYALVPGPGPSVLYLYRVDGHGVVLARARIVGAAQHSTPRLVANAEGVYVSTLTDGQPADVSRVLRLDPTTLSLRATTELGGYANLAIDGTAVVADSVARNEFLVSRLDGQTLQTDATFDVNPGNTESHLFAVSAGRLVVAYKEHFEDTRIVVEAYAIP